jgi:hypothetical protein
MPFAILIQPRQIQGETKMKREPHSKFTHAITNFNLYVVWNDDRTEDLTPHLPPALLAEIEEYLVEMDDLRTQDPFEYYLQGAGK